MQQRTAADLSDRELIDRAMNAGNGSAFTSLWNGDISGYPSHSEADQALCNLLAFWTNKDAARMDSLFRQSGLMRDKWNRRQSGTTYGNITISKAIAGCAEGYTPPQEATASPQAAGTPAPGQTTPADDKTPQTGAEQPKTAAELSKFVSAGYYQTIISDDKYKHALTTQKNKTAYIAVIDPAAFDGLTIVDGFLRLDNDTMGKIKRYTRGKYEDISEIDLPLLVQCYTAAFKSVHSYGEHTVTVYTPQFFKEMGIDTHGEKSADMMRKIAAFSDLWGFLGHDGTMGKVFDLIFIDPNKQTMTFAAPYMMRIWEKLDEKNHIERQTKKGELISYDRPYHNSLVHSTIASERNKPAVELVYLMTSGILQRGFIPDGRTYHRKQTKNVPQGIVTYSITFRTLLNNAPLLRSRIATYSSVADKNRALRRAFEKAYTLLETRTDARQYFCNLKWNSFIPTMTTLDAVLTFTHEGKDGTYKRHI